MPNRCVDPAMRAVRIRLDKIVQQTNIVYILVSGIVLPHIVLLFCLLLCLLLSYSATFLLPSSTVIFLLTSVLFAVGVHLSRG